MTDKQRCMREGMVAMNEVRQVESPKENSLNEMKMNKPIEKRYVT